jgi:cytochrome d ubiquinol oxidase subunit I
MFVLSISSWYLLKKRDVEFAKRSFRVAAAFGLASALSVIVLGDESGYTVGESQQTKLAAMEAMWETKPAPAGLTVLASINEAAQKNNWEIEIPWVMGLIGTRSLTKEIPGIHQIKAKNRERILRGIVAVNALDALRGQRDDVVAKQVFERHKADLGFGLLLKKYVSDVNQATPEIIERAVNDTVPRVTPMFWGFRIMVGLGYAMLALFGLAFWSTIKSANMQKPWLLKWALWMLPAPWVAAELGWFVAEYGRQPWTIYGVLPTHLSVSTLSVNNLYGSLAGFIVFYTALLVVEMFLMVKFARMGPGSLGTGRYQDESITHATPAPV